MMTIRELIQQGFYYARTCKSLWLFGFFVGMASGGSSGGGSGGGGGAGGVGAGGGSGAGGGLEFSGPQFALIATVLLLALAVLVVMRFVSEGALIEGVVRIRRGGTMTTSQGFRAGWAHWGVLLRIALIYVAVTIGSLAVVVGLCVIALQAFGVLAAIAVTIPAVVIAVPWLVTLYLVQAFASRIAVLENRHALDAIAKARLFLHGRLMHGLRLIVASFAGTLLIGFVGLVAVVPVVLLLIALIPVLRFGPVIVIGCLVLLPAFYVFTAMVGTLRSSIWTIGYVTQVES